MNKRMATSRRPTAALLLVWAIVTLFFREVYVMLGWMGGLK